MTSLFNFEGFFNSLDSLPRSDYGPHGIHPYPAKFKPDIPGHLISRLTNERDVVLDPMCGSGTTNVEALRWNRRTVGIDINPIAVMVSEAKTTPLDQCDVLELERLITLVDSNVSPDVNIDIPNFRNINHWFSDDVIIALANLKSMIELIPHKAARTLALVSFSAIIVRCSNQESETHWRRVEKGVNADYVYKAYSRKLADNLSRVVELSHAREDSVIQAGDARSLPVEDSSIDCVITSPPYANSHDYYLYHKLRLFWLGFPVREIQEAEFGSRNKHSDKKQPIESYLLAMDGVMTECARVLRPNSYACFVVGDSVIRGEFYNIDAMLSKIGAEVGFNYLNTHSFDQKKYTRVFNRKYGTLQPKRTHVILFQKTASF